MTETTHGTGSLSRRTVLSASGAGALLVAAGAAAGAAPSDVSPGAVSGTMLLCEPYQLDPTRSGTHVVWQFDTADPTSDVVLFDEFPLREGPLAVP